MQIFRDRTEAGARLAERLAAYRGSDALVLGIPRGGVSVAAAVAEALELECDVIVAHKLGAPGNPELAIGAVAEQGVRLLDPGIIAVLGISQAYLEHEEALQRRELERRAARLRRGRPFPNLADRAVILVDDGVATGLTTRAALQAVRRGQPSKAVLAAPVIAPEALEQLRREADQVTSLLAPPDFIAVGYWYRDFPQVSDEEAVAALEQARRTWEAARPRRAA